jgi:hypothetical protein
MQQGSKRFEALSAVLLRIWFFWDVTLYSLGEWCLIVPDIAW